jgi:HK97 family phage portal protein
MMFTKIKNVVTTLLGYPVALTPADPRLYNTGTVGTAGQCVNDHTAMTLSTVFACVRLISQTIATLPFRVYKMTDTGRAVVRDHPVDRLINRTPNTNTTAALFWQSVVSAMLLRGGAYIELRSIGPLVRSMFFLAPNRLSIQDYQGEKRYFYNEKDGSQREIPASRIMYIPGFSLDGETGISAIQYGAAIFGNAMAASTAANSSFERGLMPTVYLKNPGVVKESQRTQFRESMERIMGAAQAGRPVVLEADQDMGTIGINAKDAQLLESRQFSVEEIARWFGVPPHMIGHTSGSTSWGSGLEQQVLGFLTFTLSPLMVNISQTCNNYLIPLTDRETHYAEHVTQGLLRADSAGRAALFSQMVNNGIMTRDEVRDVENLPRRGGNADVLTVQTAMAPIDTLGQNPDA